MHPGFLKHTIEEYFVVLEPFPLNCVMNELRRYYPNMTVEYLLTEGSDHAFNLINRDQRKFSGRGLGCS
jgi:hypothetical protein